MNKTMSHTTEPILQVPDSIREDTAAYRDRVKAFLNGETSPVAFRAYRVPMGIYEQRRSGMYMVRIRIGAGLASPHQLRKIAELSARYGNSIVHVTTRQDIQIHEVRIEDTPDVLESLLEAGLSPRGGGGNTVRNVTACPRSGLCQAERFDVAPHAVATAEYLLQEPSSFNLPRKYKIVFSGCSRDCAFASVADLGFFATVKDNRKGFSVYAAGGLGPSPSVAVRIEDFVPESQVLEVAQAVKLLFDEHGDRSNKHKARLRYVLKRLGPEEFVRLYKKKRAAVAAEGLHGRIPALRDLGSRAPDAPDDNAESPPPRGPNVLAEKSATYYTIKVRLALGDISADNLRAIADIAEKYSRGRVRTTQLQNLLITSVPADHVEAVKAALRDISFDVDDTSCELVACTGAATCKLGLCLSRGLADAISTRLAETTDCQSAPTIRISGCPNSCGHHYIADVGLQGRARRINGRLMPFYDLLLGAQISEGNARLAESVGSVPAKDIPDLLARACTGGKLDTDRLTQLVSAQEDCSTRRFDDDYYYDFGSDQPFSLAGRGPGECGAGVMDIVRVDIDQACRAIAEAAQTSSAAQKSDLLYEASLASARALLVIFGLEPGTDRQTIAGFTKHLIESGWVRSDTAELLDAAIDYRLGDTDSLVDREPQVQALADRIRELFASLDANLKFRAQPAEQPATEEPEQRDQTIDLRGVACPLNFVKAKLELEKLDTGAVLQILLDDGEPVTNVPASFADQGQEVLEIKKLADHCCVSVRKTK